MKIAAFDLGTSIAVAHNAFGTDDVRVNHFTAKGNRVERAAQTLAWLQEVRRGFDAMGGLDAVVYERPFARGQNATRSLWGLAGLVEAVFGDLSALLDWTPAEIKKFTAGDAKADKDTMILFAAMDGYVGDNEHEADAWCMLRMAEKTLTKEKA